MEFPPGRVIEERAAIVHELAHVYFPNGNRLLAEGLSVYLQQAINTNPAFPNFGKDLHHLTRAITCGVSGWPLDLSFWSLDKIDLLAFDKIATPDELKLRNEDPPGPYYVVAGSFVRFLIEDVERTKTRMKRFRNLYRATPLVPWEREPGKLDRWENVYRDSLANLQTKWRNFIGRINCPPP